MKRILLLGCLLGAVMSASCGPVVTLFAQTLPITVTYTWDANDPVDGVLNYIVTLDGLVVGSPTGLTQQVTFTTYGPHTVTVAGRNVWMTGPAAVVNEVVGAPKAVKNVRRTP